jgi:hypothetical protein
MPDPEVPQSYEIRPDPQALTGNKEDPSQNASTGVDYEPHPEKSIKLEPEREKIVQSICALYSGGASEELMQVYAEKAVYDDPWYIFRNIYSTQRSFTNTRQVILRYTLQDRRPMVWHPQSHGKITDSQDRSRPVGKGSHHLQAPARIHT